MKFHEFRSIQASHPQQHARRLPWKAYFDAMYSMHAPLMESDKQDMAMTHMLFSEHIWRGVRRPFYNVYPSVVKALGNTRLDFTLGSIGFGLGYTAICFPVGHEPVADSKKVESILFQLGQHTAGVCTSFDGGKVDFEEIKEFPNTPSMSMRINFKDAPLNTPGRYLLSMDDKPISAWGLESHTNIVALCVGIAMLARDGRFAEPILLAKDQGKTFATPEERLAAIERAKNRGRNGLAIGKDIETSPHVRRPHFGIRWTEKGRSVPKLVPIAGSLVSRSKLLPVPTGYMDDIAERSRDRE